MTPAKPDTRDLVRLPRHRYFARLYALRKQLDLPPGAAPMEVKMALEGKVIEQTELMGTFAKSNGR
jgi:phosphatidylethanolamine-binding protein (PEBP) family uncharacterized protein